MKRLFVIALLALPLAAQVDIKTAQKDGKPDAVSVAINGKPFTEFFVGPEMRKPYLHPLRAASGTVVTRGYPMLTDVPGETKDHPHHRGLWFTHGDVNGLDFWAAEVSQGKGQKGAVALAKLDKAQGGKASGEIDATFNWNGPDGKTLLVEKRRMVFRAHPTLRIVDVDITLQAQGSVKFGDTKEGTFAIRLAAGLEEPQRKSPPEPKRTGLMTSAEGKTGEKEVWGKRSAWVDYAGELAGEKLGIAILEHPGNPRHPTYWHSRSYGLFAANIFGVRDFENDKSKDGSLTVEAGKSLRFRYRVVIHPGDTAAAKVPALYKAYVAGK